jgi:protoporphyrinogen/coproporphyrinogen III oxidase
MADASVAIVGAGVSGLAAAYFLAQQGIRPVLIEQSNRAGGLIRTDHLRGCILEAGPDSYLAAKPAVTELCGELPGMSEQIIGSNDAARRIFVVRHAQLVPMPRGMAMMVPGDLSAALNSSLFSPATKLRFFAETLSRPRTRQADVSVGEFIADHFGTELLEYAAEPLLAGVYGGDSASLSAPSVLPRFVEYERAHGSLIRAVRRENRARTSSGGLFRSFRDGMQMLTDRLAQGAALRQATAQRIQRRNGSWRVHCDGEDFDAGDVVLACPAHTAARLLEGLSPRLAGELAEIRYSSAILVTLVWDRHEIAHPFDGFGFLVPKAERQTIAAATWVSTKFPSRIPPDLAAVRGFIVGENASDLRAAPERQIVELVRSDLRRCMGIDAAPCVATVHSWPDSMPQYVVGHRARVHRIQAALEHLPGLHLIGNAYDGVGIPDCVRLAKQTAKRIGASRLGAGAFSSLEGLES